MKLRYFRAWILLLKADGPDFWFWANWKGIAEAIHPLVATLDSSTFIYPSCGGAKNLPRSFSWKKDAMQRWSFSSPLTVGESDLWRFGYVQLSSPSHKKAFASDMRPDFYFDLSALHPQKDKPSFLSQSVLVAVAEDIFERNESLVCEMIRRITEQMKPVYTAEIRTKWGFKTDDDGVPGGLLGSWKLNEAPISKFFRKSWNASVEPREGMLDLSGANFTVLKETVKS